MRFPHPRLAVAIVLCACGFAPELFADVLGTQTITNADHYGYWGFQSTSQFNTKAVIGPFSGTARRIQIEGTITKVHPDAWASSIRVQPSGSALAINQPWYQFTNQREFTGTIPVSATVHIPGGFNLGVPLNLEMFSIDSEQFVPGLDARSTLTYTFHDNYLPGTAQYIGTLANTDPTFQRPQQFPSSAPSGWTEPILLNRFPHYDSQPFHVDAAGSYTMVTANEYYSAAVLYQNNFDPASPLANIMWAFSQTANTMRNNTFNNLSLTGDATGGSVIVADLVPGVQYFFVTTAFDSPNSNPGSPVLGRYGNLITGPGTVMLGIVPEPGVTLGVVSLVGLALVRSRR